MAKPKLIAIANHHTAPVHLPKMYLPNTSGDPAQMKAVIPDRLIPSGRSVEISADELEVRKTSPAFQYYVDHGHLEIVKKEGEVDVTTGATTDLEVPDHLQVDGEGAVTVASSADPSVQVKGKIVSQKAGTATV